MNLDKRKKAFVTLGSFIRQFLAADKPINCNKVFYSKLEAQVIQAVNHNGWFTKENVLFALKSWADVLTEKNVEKWVAAYDFSKVKIKTVGIVTAGNIPLVGFHDFLSVLLAGHNLVIKQSSSDQKLLPVLADYLKCIEPEFKNHIAFIDERLKNFDAVIATGSNNTARYFEYYFQKYPSIIRKNRNAVAVLTGAETKTELEALGDDVFRYFGLGCRSVSKIFVPKNYDFDKLFRGVFQQQDILSYRKYKNNYDYNKTVYLMSQIPLLENGFLLLKEDATYASPIATLFYEYYDSPNALNKILEQDKEEIQCIVSTAKSKNRIPFGQTQQPQLWDYADGVDTLKFLLSL